MQTTIDVKWQYLTWSFGSCELKREYYTTDQNKKLGTVEGSHGSTHRAPSVFPGGRWGGAFSMGVKGLSSYNNRGP